MQNQWKQVDRLQEQFHKRFWTRIIKKNHKGRRVDKAITTSNFLYRNRIYVGELCLALFLSFSTLIFGSGNATPNNRELVYPLQEISTVECRTQERSSLQSECKIPLPIIKGANYAEYENVKEYTDSYSVLFGGSYTNGWRTDLGSHYAVDIATAKGTPLYALADGKVYFAGQQAGYGNVVKVEFIYQGIPYFAIYAHMDALSVKTGETVSRGQKVWTVGNSGITAGELGGFHVHFEVAKGDKGRPVYAFFGCEDLKKGSTQVINQGLCRTEMFNTTVDPIALLETANAKLPYPIAKNEKSENEHPSAPEIQVDTADRDQILKIAKLYLDSPYQLGGTGTSPGNPTDCSRFTQNVFAQAGIELERSSADQAHQFSNGGYWYDSLENAEIGDLLFFKQTYDTGTDKEITHVGIYAGNGMMIHAANDKVQISPFNGYWKEHFKGLGAFKFLSKGYNKEKAQKNYLALNATPSSTGLPVVKPEPLPPLPEQINPVQPLAPKTENLISLESSRLDAIGKKFFEERSINLKGNTSAQLKKGESRTFTLQIKKENGDSFNGILKQPIILVANSTNITIEPVAISLVKNGEVEIKLTANQSGPVYTAINMGTNKMWGMNMQVL